MEQLYHERLRKYRENAHLTQEELAERIEVSRQTVSKWERGEASPDTDNLIKLSSLYQVTVDALLKNDPCEALELAVPVAEPTEEPHTEHGKDDRDDDDDDWDDDDWDDIPENRSHMSFWLHFPVSILCTVVFFCLGFFGGYWHPGWIVFLAIPVWDGVIRAIFERNLRRLPISVLTAAVYLILGCCFDLWHPGWLVFLLIPIFGYIQHFFS